MRDTRKFVRCMSLFCIISLMTSFAFFAGPQVVQANAGGCGGRWVLTVTISDGDYPNGTYRPGALYSVDTATDTLYGPFLEGQMGTAGGGLFDIAVTPDCRTAIVSNFGDSRINFVDVSNPTDLHFLGYLNITHFAEDIAITHDGRFALVANGGFSPWLTSINIASRTPVEAKNLTHMYGVNVTTWYANAVDVAPDGTVVIADYFQGAVHTLTIDGMGHLTLRNNYSLPFFFTGNETFMERPVNVAFAPDGETVLVMSVACPHVTVYRKTNPGTLAYQGRVMGLPSVYRNTTKSWSGSRQSVAFSCDGTKAYVINNGLYNDTKEYFDMNEISVLNINGPGSVSLNTAYAATLFCNSSSQLFGVDCLASPCAKLYVGNPTVSGGVNFLHAVDLNDFSVNTIPVGQTESGIVVGVATCPCAQPAVGGVVVSADGGALLAPLLGIAAVLIAPAAILRLRGKSNRAKGLN